METRTDLNDTKPPVVHPLSDFPETRNQTKQALFVWLVIASILFVLKLKDYIVVRRQEIQRDKEIQFEEDQKRMLDLNYETWREQVETQKQEYQEKLKQYQLQLEAEKLKEEALKDTINDAHASMTPTAERDKLEQENNENVFEIEYQQAQMVWASLTKFEKAKAWLGFRNEYIMLLSAKQLWDEECERNPSLKEDKNKNDENEFADWVNEVEFDETKKSLVDNNDSITQQAKQKALKKINEDDTSDSDEPTTNTERQSLLSKK